MPLHLEIDRPLPWRVDGSETTTAIWVSDAKGARVATVANHDHDADVARLVAASPRMAKALHRAASIFAELPRSEQSPQMLALREEIVECIKQATPKHYGLLA